MLGRTLQAIFRLIHRQLPRPVLIPKLPTTEHETGQRGYHHGTKKGAHVKRKVIDIRRKQARIRQKMARRAMRLWAK